MKNPFKKGDTVYHPISGKALVLESSEEFVSLRYGAELAGTWTDYRTVSFERWPKPVHKRPFEPSLKAGQRVIVVAKGNSSLQHLGVVQGETVETVKLKLYDRTEDFAKSSYHFYTEAQF